jgi:hypothetical protein
VCLGRLRVLLESGSPQIDAVRIPLLCAMCLCSSSSSSSLRLVEAQLVELQAELRERDLAHALALEKAEASRVVLESTLRAQGDELDILRGKAAQCASDAGRDYCDAFAVKLSCALRVLRSPAT